MSGAIKVIGIGSPFGADCIGWRLVDTLRAQAIEGLCFDKLDRPGAALLDHMAGWQRVILIDAMQGGGAVGEVRALCLEEVIEQNRLLSSHGFGVGQCLALGRALGALPGSLTIVGVELGDRPEAVEASELACAEHRGVALVLALLSQNQEQVGLTE